MKGSCRAGLHRELLNSTPSALHPVKRISGMHLKPYLKLQKKERPLEVSLEPPRSPPMSQQRLAGEQHPSSAKPGLLPPAPLWKPPERPSAASATTAGHRSGSRSHAEGTGALPPPTIHQGDGGEGPLDIWAVVKPGNTKEKVAFFAAQQWSSGGRVSTGKNKSTWDIDGRATKRRKKSLDIKKAKIHLERMREANGRCFQPEPFACSVVHCSVHNVNDGGEAAFPGRHLSVIEMVAFLEQRAGVLLADCSKHCPGAPALATKVSGQPRAAPLPLEAFSATGAYEAPPEKAPSGGDGGEDGEGHAEPLRVLDMVAKLESECLKRQSEREAGSLSRNNSFRRNVGRVLLASKTLSESEARKASSEALGQEECDAEEGGWSSGRGSSGEAHPWNRSAPGCSSSFGDALEGDPDLKLDERGSETPKTVAKAPRSASSEKPRGPPHSPQGKSTAVPVDCPLQELRHPNADIRARESLSVRISAVKTEAGCRSPLLPSPRFGEDSLPGKLFLLLSSHCEPPREREVPAEARRAEAPGSSPAAEPLCPPGSRGSGEPPASPPEGALQAAGSSHLKRQRSHDFLETRFKIQQLLEPQQYLLFLPHHIIVKIFGFLPTRSLVALKCTCGYFKFVIEYYNIRPADSRWVRDPRYREDPCKHCKKTFTKGDVSLCRWHPKPYCQALPYGPGYWMCCHRSQKSVPGCKLGLHDNHWVPACHSFNRALHKKSREPEEEC